MDEDPQAKNYDPEHRIIRSLFTGSRGPLLRKATALDWAGDPIEVEGRFDPAHGERNFEEMLAHFEDYTDVVGDHPINLAATTLGLNAFMVDAEKKYRDWVVEYVDAWAERAAANNGDSPQQHRTGRYNRRRVRWQVVWRVLRLGVHGGRAADG